MSQVLIIGTIGIDNIETPSGQFHMVQGGSCSYSAVSASYFTEVGIVCVVGGDYPEEHRRVLTESGIDMSGMQIVPEGKTFAWGGRYKGAMNEAHTVFTTLGVFADFKPIVSEQNKKTPYLLLCNLDPISQMSVLDQVEKPVISILDTMNLWIDIRHEELLQAMKRVDVAVLNEGEARMLCNTAHLQDAAKRLLDFGPKRIIIKKGEHGALMLSQSGDYFVAPAFPLQVKDPTGAGDTFAGALIGHLARTGATVDSDDEWRRAIIYGTAMAGFTCEGVSLSTLKNLDKEKINNRYEAVCRIAAIPQHNL